MLNKHIFSSRYIQYIKIIRSENLFCIGNTYFFPLSHSYFLSPQKQKKERKIYNGIIAITGLYKEEGTQKQKKERSVS